jgi:hypothetical protein
MGVRISPLAAVFVLAVCYAAVTRASVASEKPESSALKKASTPSAMPISSATATKKDGGALESVVAEDVAHTTTWVKPRGDSGARFRAWLQFWKSTPAETGDDDDKASPEASPGERTPAVTVAAVASASLEETQKESADTQSKVLVAAGAGVPPPVGMPHGVRAASLVERLSASIESIGATLFGAVSAVARMRDAFEPPHVHSVNETMIVAHVPATLLGEDATKIAISHISVIDGRLSVNLVASHPGAAGTNGSNLTIYFGENFPASISSVMKVGQPRVEKETATTTALFIPVMKIHTGQVSARPASVGTASGAEWEKYYSGVPHEGHIEEDAYEVLRICLLLFITANEVAEKV